MTRMAYRTPSGVRLMLSTQISALDADPNFLETIGESTARRKEVGLIRSATADTLSGRNFVSAPDGVRSYVGDLATHCQRHQPVLRKSINRAPKGCRSLRRRLGWPGLATGDPKRFPFRGIAPCSGVRTGDSASDRSRWHGLCRGYCTALLMRPRRVPGGETASCAD
jgi:hypothetical protein